ncbi:MAG TPA: hypothetical protein VE035_17680 [Puia sp.]|nr:hypothetical protein [Puia sp.]
MLLSFSLFKYSLVVGFLKKTATAGVIPARAAEEDVLFRLAHILIKELRVGIGVAADKKLGREDLLLFLGLLLKPYTPLRHLPFRVAINNFILMETLIRCSIDLRDEELLMLWREIR